MPLLLTRHAQANIVPTEPTSQWPLSDEGRAAATVLGHALAGAPLAVTRIVSSTERRAMETATILAEATGGALQTDRGLNAVARPHTTDYRAEARAYLEGADLPGWERRRSVVARFGRAVAQREPGLVVVTHGVPLALWLSSILATINAPTFWERLSFPEAWSLDPGRETITRLAVPTS